jgi:hypothetical protein
MNKNSPSCMLPEQSRGAIQIDGIHLLTGIVWLSCSDRLAAGIAPGTTALTSINIYKGWGCAFATTVLPSWLIRWNPLARERNDGTPGVLLADGQPYAPAWCGRVPAASLAGSVRGRKYE